MNKKTIILLSVSLSVLLLCIVVCMLIYFNRPDQEAISNKEEEIVLKPRVDSDFQADADKYVNTCQQLQERLKRIDVNNHDMDSLLAELNDISEEFQKANDGLSDDTAKAIQKDNPELAKQLQENIRRLKEIQEKSANQ